MASAKKIERIPDGKIDQKQAGGQILPGQGAPQPEAQGKHQADDNRRIPVKGVPGNPDKTYPYFLVIVDAIGMCPIEQENAGHTCSDNHRQIETKFSCGSSKQRPPCPEAASPGALK